MSQRPFRFGAVIHGARSREDWKEQACSIEAMGYSTIQAPDHFEMVNISPTIALMAAADATKRLRIGSFVLNNDLRHPAVLAKEIATLDLLSGGRVELGLGSGYLPDDYTWSGIPYNSAGTRIRRLEESIQILKALFSEEPTSFEGKYYSIQGLNGLPKPLQKPHPPMYIGGGGKRMLALAARQADIVGLTAIVKPGEGNFEMNNITAQATEQKLSWIREAAGERFEQLELNSFVFSVKVTDAREMVAGHIAQGVGLSAEQVLHSPHFLIGTVQQICETLYRQREQHGITYFSVLGSDSIAALAPVIEQLAGS